MDNNLKYKILKDLSETLDFAETIKKNPQLSRGAIRDILIEASEHFICKDKNKSRLPYNPLHLTINIDGASRGNPGESGIGAVIKDGSGNIIKKISRFIGIATNNSAEYQSLILAIETAKELGAEEVSVYADSELLVKQIKGEYKIKSEGLKPLYHKAVDILKGFKSYGIIHIRREKNKEADELANQAIDKKKLNGCQSRPDGRWGD